MELLNPTRITSLEAQRIRIIHHVDERRRDEFTLENVYPFETIYNLKQRISQHFSGEKAYLPRNLFVAQEVGGGFYRTVEFYWPFGKDLKDPFVNAGKPDPRIYTDDARKPVFPTILSGITIETGTDTAAAGGAGGADLRIIHVWSLEDIATAAGFSADAAVTQQAYDGFFSLYFPLLENSADVQAIFEPVTDAETEEIEFIDTYRSEIDARLAKVETGLQSLNAAAPFRLRELRALRYMLPKKERIAKNSLELRFYDMAPSAAVPFIRFFPAQEKSAPLVKLAATPTGLPLISNTRVLDALMAEEPDTEKGAVIILKAPIVHPQAKEGTAWTLRIFQNGTGELKIGAPRRDAPLFQAVLEAAFAVLPEFLDETPWGSEVEKTLIELTAVYDFRSRLEEKPSKAELRKRLDAFLPFFNEERIPEAAKINMMLRYKAVSNFEETRDPIKNFITNLFTRDAFSAVGDIPTEAYISALSANFGLPPAEAAQILDRWIDRHAEYVLADRDTAISALNMGAAVSIATQSHPNYTFFLGGVESYTDLQRILSLLTVFASLPSSELAVARTVAESKSVAAAAAAAVEEDLVPETAAGTVAAPVQGEAIGEFGDFGDFGGFGDFGNVGAAAAAAAAPAEPVEGAPAVEEKPVEIPAVKEIDLPDVLKENERIAPVGTGWFLERLEAADSTLFRYRVPKDDKRIGSYGVKCQKNAHKQPFVLTAENYARARAIYGNDVFWVEAPLELYDLQAATLANKTVDQRRSFGTKELGKSLQEVKEMERRALELGFPLKGDESVTLKDAKSTAEERTRITALIAAQKEKPLWTIIRAGSVMARPNYYMCGILWCIRDDLPLIPAEFAGTKLRNGDPKEANSCAFCGGKIITNPKDPQVGETVFERDPSGKGSSKIAQYIGYPKEVYHPEGYPLPCCFVDPDDLAVPPTDKKAPPPLVPLPEGQEAAVAAAAEAPAAPAAPPAAEPADIDNRDRPFSAAGIRGGAQNRWYIPNQNVVGRIATDWYELKKGEVGVPPPSVNRLFGQNPTNFLTANKGVLGASINSYLRTPGSAFIRYGLGGSGILGLIAYAQYATAALTYDVDTMKIKSTEAVSDFLFGTKQFALAHAFEQANYGTLLHEFASSRAFDEVEFQTWCGKMGIPLPAQRPYAEQFYGAWLNFQEYINDPKQPIDLRLFEGLFASPNLFTPTGFILVKIHVPKKVDEPAIIECPEFGISATHQNTKPPLLFVVQDAASGNFDPLVLYEGISKDEKRLLGVLQPETPAFGELSATLREPLAAFLAQYYGPVDGCGRITEPIHPWIPELESTSVPRLRPLYTKLESLGIRFESLLRDRSNRLVGCLVRPRKPAGSPLFYIPTLDDGTIINFVSSMRGEEALPKPPLKALLDFLMGARYPVAAGKPASDENFPGLLPVKLIQDGKNYVALELQCGATVPFEPFAITSTIMHERFAQMISKDVVEIDVREDFPWDTDIILLGPKPADAENISQTDEEALDEAYQHLRISFSNWLHASAAGAAVKRQIELLRAARKRLPLWELRKRMDILIGPIISGWISSAGKSVPSMLRRDCLQISKKKKCTGGCTWAGDDARCLIHAVGTPRFTDPKRVLTARLVDELMRTFGQAMEVLKQTVPRLRPLAADQIVREESELLFTAEGRGSEPLFSRLGYIGRRPSTYTRGLTYPEEVDVDKGEEAAPEIPIMPAEWASKLRQAAFGADIARDRRAQLEAALLEITDMTLDTLETRIGGPFTGTPENWRALAKLLSIHVLTTLYNHETKLVEIYQWYSGQKGKAKAEDERRFVILDVFGVPLQRIKKGEFVIKEKRLPASIRAWLESHTPN